MKSRTSAIMVVTAALFAAVGCTAIAGPAGVATTPTPSTSAEGWVAWTVTDWGTGESDRASWARGIDRVIVRFEGYDERELVTARTWFTTVEHNADEALAAAGGGFVDSGDFLNSGTDIYFGGGDSAVIWDVLEPIFDAAPVAWTSVEKRTGVDDESPVSFANDAG